MFVVKRPFKSFGKVYTAGTVIAEPAAIKRFKARVAEGKIIKVTEQTYETTKAYFKAKYHVDLPAFNEAEAEPVEAEIVKEVKAKPVKAKVK